MPLRAYTRHRFTVVGHQGGGARRHLGLHQRGSHLEELSAEPGQYFRWRFLTRSLWWSLTPLFAVRGAPAGTLRITVKDLGDHSQALEPPGPGTRVFAEGPYGAFTPAVSGRGVLLLAGGLGITPLRAIFATLPGPVTLIYRASRQQDVVFRGRAGRPSRPRAAPPCTT